MDEKEKEDNSIIQEKLKKFNLKEANLINYIQFISENIKSNITNVNQNYEEIIKYYPKYSDIITKMKKCEQRNKLSKELFYSNLLLLPSILNTKYKIDVYRHTTYCYQELNLPNLMFNIYHKMENSKFKEELISLTTVFRFAYFFNRSNIIFYGIKYIKKVLDIVKNGKISNDNKNIINNEYNELETKMKTYIEAKKDLFNDKNYYDKILNIKSVIDLIFSEKNKINKEDNKYIYVINLSWLNKAKKFIDSINPNNINLDNIFNKDSMYNYYFDEKKESKSNIPFPGPIDNVALLSYKDCWFDDENLDENDFIKKNKNKDSYCLVNYNDWKLLDSFFGSTNEIKRKANNLELVELKFLLLDQKLRENKDNYRFLKQKYIQIGKNKTCKQLKDKILNCVNNNLNNKESNGEQKKGIFFYKLKKEHKELLIEIICAYKKKNQFYESLYIEKIEMKDNEKVNEFLKRIDIKNNVLVIELVKLDDLNFLVQLENKNKCTACGKEIKDINSKYYCKICNYSLFCSSSCAKNSNEHKAIDSKLKKIFYNKYSFKEFYDTFRESYQNSIFGINNPGSSSYIISSLQCLFKTDLLTNYMLNDYMWKDLNCEYNSLVYEYWYLIYQVNSGRMRENYLEPKNFKDAYIKMNKDESGDGQDAYEFINRFLAKLHNLLNIGKKKNNYELPKQKENETDEEVSKRTWDNYKLRNNSIIVDLFDGQYKSSTRCSNCKRVSVIYDNFRILELPIPSNKVLYKFKLFTQDWNCIMNEIKIDENTEMKDIIINSVKNLNSRIYFEYIKSKKMEDELFNFNAQKVPESILYDNIKILEFDKDYKMTKIYTPNYENLYTNNFNKKDIPFDRLRYLDFSKKKSDFELVLYENNLKMKNTKSVDIYLYPVVELENDMNLFGNSKETKIVSYPVVLTISTNDTFQDLESMVLKRFSNILYSNYRSVKDSITICCPHFKVNYEILKTKDGKCPICTKANDGKFCVLFENMEKDKKISDLVKIYNSKPIIFYAKSFFYLDKCSLYSGYSFYSKKVRDINKNTLMALNDLLSYQQIYKEIDGDEKWCCTKCGGKKGERKYEIYKTPLYLIIQFKRFKKKKLFFSKNDIAIDYDRIMDLKDYIIGGDKTNSVYELYGVIINEKFMGSEHYIAYCKYQGQWIMIDDTNYGGAQNYFHKDAYILFYKIRNSSET